MLDLENREVLIQYLLEKGVIHSDIPYEVNYCRGGVSCIAALIETEGKTMLVKQGRAKLAVKEDWHADPARMKIEAIANDLSSTSCASPPILSSWPASTLSTRLRSKR